MTEPGETEADAGGSGGGGEGGMGAQAERGGCGARSRPKFRCSDFCSSWFGRGRNADKMYQNERKLVTQY